MIETTSDMERKALRIISVAFKDKKDKGGHDYVSGHLKRLWQEFLRLGSVIEIRTIALLHDLLEDCPEWTEEMLREEFPVVVVDSVVALTRKKEQSYDEFITQVLANDYAIVVKKADLKDNMDLTRLETIDDNDWKRMKRYHAAYKRLKNKTYENAN